jgi:S-DNA-T family DNA segregation ATPase FtsK/SpoIIIE
VPIGIGEPKLDPVFVDLTRGDPHLLVFGDSESGKTNLLRAYVAGLTSQHSPDEVQILFVDYRRTLLGAAPDDYIVAYAGSQPAAIEAVGRLCGELQARLPGPQVSYAELRQRSWWSGPEYYLVIDDYDLVVSPSGNPLLPLLDLLAQARDVGLHLVVARRAGGASRALFEPVLQRLKELGCVGVLLSGDPQEGPLLGTLRPSPQPSGRGLLVQRQQRPVLVQVGLVPD